MINGKGEGSEGMKMNNRGDKTREWAIFPKRKIKEPDYSGLQSRYVQWPRSIGKNALVIPISPLILALSRRKRGDARRLGEEES